MNQHRGKTPVREIFWSGAYSFVAACKNPISVFGILVVAFTTLAMFSFWAFAISGTGVNRYLEVVFYLILPGVFAFGLLVVAVGVYFKRRRDRKRGVVADDAATARSKVNELKGTVGIFLAVTAFVVMPTLSVSGYHLYSYTESTRFCGELCHTVMTPQATAHARSAHARVACAECHIGEGASWFVKAKLSGMRQVYAVLTDSFSRPIPPAITELRPASETCEHCHWPARFFGRQYKELIHYGGDKDNQRRRVEILIEIGGSDDSLGRSEGIHSQMLTTGSIEYASSDEKLQEIPWVRYERTNGDVSVYTAREGQEISKKVEAAEVAVHRQLDCMDCHNRGAHHFRSPQIVLDLELEAKRIDRTLPFIKRAAVAALIEPYDDIPTAMDGIGKHITSFYRENAPQLWAKREGDIRKAIERTRAVYRENFFPEMKEDWRTYPENIGHQFSSGCFRCHDGKHVDEQDRVITSDCDTCHVFVNRSDESDEEFSFGRFEHPNSLIVHKKLRCHSCHGSGQRPRCADCHDSKDWKAARGKGQLRRIGEEQPEHQLAPDGGVVDAGVLGWPGDGLESDAGE
ncbi:MAG: NapC/NirT family cytochrome c [Deltaproteobacteria bacterium]|nr:NapC/NirT family cytochrome c [Deltaproteobacteria bacterium]